MSETRDESTMELDEYFDPMDVDREPEKPLDSSEELDDYDEEESEASLADSSLGEHFVLEEHYENGRRYANETYFYPNDDPEETRLNIIHQIYLQLLRGELTVARITQDVERILDVGAGPGDWAIAMAEKYPNAEIIATDVTTYRPTNLPPNVTFQIDDAMNEWTYMEQFDFIHMRDLYGAFQDWNHIFREVRKHLKDDGKLEIANAGRVQSGKNYDKSWVAIFYALFVEAIEKSGVKWAPGAMRGELEAAGLRILQSITMEVPLGLWHEDPKKTTLGKMGLVACLESVEAASMRLFTKYLGWTPQQVRDISEKVSEEVKDGNNRATLTVEFVVARKMPSVLDYP